VTEQRSNVIVITEWNLYEVEWHLRRSAAAADAATGR